MKFHATRIQVIVAIVGLTLLIAAFGYGVLVGKYQLFPYRAIGSLQEWVLFERGNDGNGRKLYQSECADCHGADGNGGFGPTLRNPKLANRSLHEIIRRGIPGTEMPGTSLSSREIKQLASYVQSLAKQPLPVENEGDPAAGERLFHVKGGCSTCHKVYGQGGSFGPDLSKIGASRSAAYLRRKLIAPDETLGADDWKVEITDAEGRSRLGALLNEDSYSVQIRSLDERLLSYEKAELRDWKVVRSSFMESYVEILSDEDLDHLVAYLGSLRGSADR